MSSIYEIIKTHLKPFYYSYDDSNALSHRIAAEVKEFIADKAVLVMQRARSPQEQALIEKLCELVGADSNN